MTDYQLLKATTEKMLKDTEERIETEWFSGVEYQRAIYKRERLKGFKQYIKLTKEYQP